MKWYEIVIRGVLSIEGGSKVTNHPLDKGGLTKYGISQRSYPKLDIKNLTEEDAIKIYKTNYWDRCNCDNLPKYVAEAVFSCAVNCGSSTAVKMLQKAIGVKADGIVGPKTIAAVNNPKSKTFKSFIFAWVKRYIDIAKKDSSQMVFLNGWINRVLRIFLPERIEGN